MYRLERLKQVADSQVLIQSGRVNLPTTLRPGTLPVLAGQGHKLHHARFKTTLLCCINLVEQRLLAIVCFEVSL